MSDAGGGGTFHIYHQIDHVNVGQANITISHGQMGLQNFQSFVKTRVSTCGDRTIALDGLVCRTVVFILHLYFQCSSEGTLFVLRNVEFHHHIAIHRPGIGPCT
jgi:hypothetical protein